MPPWNIEQTRTLMADRHGSEQPELANNCLRSVTERMRHARYHFQEARRLLKEAIDDRLPIESIYLVTWPTQAEERSAFNSCLMMVEANAIACAQAIHSIADNLAHVVYFAMGMNLGARALRERDVTILRVIAELEANQPRYADVAKTLKTFLAEPSFIAVEAFVNVAKHRGYSETRLNIDPPGRASPYILEFGAFAYRDVAHPEREIEEVLAPAYAATSRAVVETGDAINLVLLR